MHRLRIIAFDKASGKQSTLKVDLKAVRKGNKLLSECGIQLKRPPVRPRWHPLHRLQGRTYPEIWKNFLDAAYWNVELKE